MALVSPQRKSPSPIGEEPAHSTLILRRLSSRAKRGILVLACRMVGAAVGEHQGPSLSLGMTCITLGF